MTDTAFNYFATSVSTFLDELYEAHRILYTKFCVYFDGRRQCRVGQALYGHAEEHPEWNVRIMRAPYHKWKGAAQRHSFTTTAKLKPNAILVVRDDRYPRPEVESFIGYAMRYKIVNSDSCYRVQILLPQHQSRCFEL